MPQLIDVDNGISKAYTMEAASAPSKVKYHVDHLAAGTVIFMRDTRRQEHALILT